MFRKKSSNPAPELKRTAIVYDYDGTLAKGNIQEHSFLPSVGLDTSEFWEKVKLVTKENDSDEILVYMQLMLQEAKANGNPLTKERLKNHGKTSNLFNGLKDDSWFTRLNKFAKDHGLHLEHYIVSSGTQEMIEGSPIASHFRKIFASRYIYDDNGEASWPSLAINYTTKTQFLFRINKGVENAWDNTSINAFMPENERPIPFSRIIFIGDGDTDIPAMKMTTYNGGHSIATYDPQRDTRTLGKIHALISDGRADFTAPADYSENTQMDIMVKGILGRIARSEGFRPN
ncbi:HAD family hydrolase [Litorimonas haliclonae]|uniref:HAD family hydrolase n=1 Tax=Litorimonas haliclonae TaxID=2081977 RepID=UPI0039EDF5C1